MKVNPEKRFGRMKLSNVLFTFFFLANCSDYKNSTLTIEPQNDVKVV